MWSLPASHHPGEGPFLSTVPVSKPLTRAQATQGCRMGWTTALPQGISGHESVPAATSWGVNRCPQEAQLRKADTGTSQRHCPSLTPKH